MVDILLVEDNEELKELMSRFLVKAGFSITSVTTGEAVFDFLEKESAALVLLDLMLPHMDGFAVCQKLRQKNEVPIVILSAMSDKEAKISAYELGADDYIEKPLDIDLLIAKITALFKRCYEKKENGAVIRSGGIELNQDTMLVFCDKKQIEMTMKEYDLLLLFLENEGKTLSKEFLFHRIWGMNSESENQTLTVHIKMLRDKIERDKKNPVRIKTVWGVGYRYEKN